MKKSEKKVSLSISEREFPSLSGAQNWKEVTYERGVAQFTMFTALKADDKIPKGSNVSSDRKLSYRFLSELKMDHGFSLTYGILHNAGFYNDGPTEFSSLLKEIFQRLDVSAGRYVKQKIARLNRSDPDEEMSKVFTIAVWAELFEEKFTDVWLAAMAQHAYFIDHDDYAFGYLISGIDHRHRTETHFLRGKIGLESAQAGGLARAAKHRATTEKTLSEIARRLKAKHSLARAADLAYQAGFGSGKLANIKLWNRHRSE